MGQIPVINSIQCVTSCAAAPLPAQRCVSPAWGPGPKPPAVRLPVPRPQELAPHRSSQNHLPGRSPGHIPTSTSTHTHPRSPLNPIATLLESPSGFNMSLPIRKLWAQPTRLVVQTRRVFWRSPCPPRSALWPAPGQAGGGWQQKSQRKQWMWCRS